ncbi:hypothetical protein SKAU_G00118600 [Synaphobranchus kaupii]|uniref:Ig-like domain-containing protein n=1 Tax=Synaphobranchus kaupii TaxID=118154 RepID=A0A9Q1FNE6_SYNKA|nr:hypothetical protein SKAU_G00118600 [Synaphobranchus kaupii]
MNITVQKTTFPNMTLYHQLRSDPTEAKRVSLICSLTGFYPKEISVEWKEDKKPFGGSPVVSNMEGEDKKFSQTSQVDVDIEKWISGSEYTCNVTQNTYSKELSTSICSMTPPSSQTAELFLIGPPLQDTWKQKGLPFVCLLVGFDTSYFTISWKVNGTTPQRSAKTEPPNRNDNGTETVRSTFNVKSSDWRAGSQITCEARHLCSDKPLERHLLKAKDPRPPTVKIMAPFDSELVKSGNATLLCVVSDLFPSQAEVHWELNGERLPPSRYTSGPPLRISGSSSYAMHSWLQVPESDQAEGEYSCVVRHESSDMPVNSHISNVFAISPPQAALLQFSKGLICLVHGFSPAAINVTWLLNGRTELLESNTSDVSRGADGRFSLWSHLQVSWEPGALYTCRVAHVTKTLNLSKSQPEISTENEYFNENTHDPSSVDSPEEIWNTVYAFVILFLVTLLYSVISTLVLIK